MIPCHFSSDNTTGVHPKIMQALCEAADGAALPYGDDEWSLQAEADFKKIFGDDIHVFLVPQGTGSNILGIRALVRPWQSLLASETAHTCTSESGAVEALAGCRMTLLPAPHGKLSAGDIPARCTNLHTPHETAPGALLLTQITEVGTVYSVEEVRDICKTAHAHGLPVHMDGARFANAVAALGCDARALARDAGVDMLSFGGTKNGLMFGEAIVIFNPAFAKDFATLRKQSLQLMSKHRYLGAQFVAYLKDDLWLESARHANAMARRMADGLAAMPHVAMAHPVDANMLFANLPVPLMQHLLTRFSFNEVDPVHHTARWVCSFNTTEQQVDDLLNAIKTFAEAPSHR